MLNHFYTRPISILLALLCALSLPNRAFASSIPQQINFQNILENKDILFGEGASIFQDSEGFMWLGGSRALIRYDGYEFKQIEISVDGDTSNKSPIYYVETLFEDSHHQLWVGTRSGLLLYNSRSERLKQVKDDDNQKLKLSNSTVLKIIELPTGELIAGSSAGLFIIDPMTYQYTTITPDANRSDWLRGERIECVLFDGNKDIFLGTDAGLEKLHWASKSFTFYKINNDNPDSTADTYVNDIVADRDGKLWLATKHGLVHFDPKTHQQKRYLKDNSNRFSLGGNDIWSLLLDSHGDLWVGIDGGGVSIYDADRDRFINHKHEIGRAGSLSSNVVRTLFEDRNGDVWIGNYPEGINFFDRSSSAIISYANDIANPKSLSNTSVLSVAEDALGNLWLGTDGGGLNRFDRELNEFSHFKTLSNDATTISGDDVLSVYVDATGIVWAGTWSGGISSYDPVKQQFTRYPFDPQRIITSSMSTSFKLNSKSVWSLMDDQYHNLWMGTHTGGLSKYNRETKLFTHYTHQESDPSSINSNLVWTTFEDSLGNFWVGTAAGLNLMDRDAGAFIGFVGDPGNASAMTGASVFSFFEDSKKRFWVGTSVGLSLMDRQTKTFTVFNKKNGFLNDSIKSITEDTHGILWVNTDNGFASFDPETKKIKNYNRLNGRFIGDSKSRISLLSRRGDLIFVGMNGLRIVNPNELSENKVIPPVVLTDFKLFSDSVIIGDNNGILSTAINHSDTIQLDYTQSNFTINFSALNFRGSEKNKYLYKLDGFDKNWVDAGTQRAAKYTNIAPGKYAFKVRGSNNDGLWNDNEKAITIIQLPAPWKTWWAFTVYSLAVISVIFLFVYSQRKKRLLVEDQNRFLEMKVLERTAELREKNDDIEIMLSNMQQGLFTIDIGGTIHPEYSHFLEDIFETHDIAGRSATALLFETAQLGGDMINIVKTCINAIVGEDVINYEFNSHLLIRDYDADIHGNLKSLSLDWNAVVAHNRVVKLMVSVRDVTLLKIMESEARNKKRELAMISQLLNVPAKKYVLFAESVQRFIEHNRVQIESNEQPNDLTLALLFRNMHTIKGNCRTFNFDYLSDIAHEVESVYAACKSNSFVEWDREKFITDLQRLTLVMQEYNHIFYDVLGRGNKGEIRDQHGFWADANAIEALQRGVETALSECPSLHQSQALLPIQLMLTRALSSPVSEILSDILSSLPSIASQLNKEPPLVDIDDNQVRIKSSAVELITNIFSHILRNSIDHGIEIGSVRLQAGKPSVGAIDIWVVPRQKCLQIYVKDDGQGINIDRLFKKGVEMGRWKVADQPSYSDIANLIFASGVSTTEAVTNISGRGVGMDAVKAFLIAQGGNISLQLLGPKANDYSLDDGVKMPFELIIELPENMYIVAT